MSKLSHIAIGLFVVSNTAYDLFATLATSWSIFFYTCTYLSLMIWTIKEFIASKKKDLYFAVMGVGLGVRVVMELQKIGMDYETYLKSVNHYEQNLLFAFFLISLLLIVVQKKWKKR